MESETARDKAGITSEDQRKAEVYAGRTCGRFKASPHANSRHIGPMSRCVVCGSLAHQHWLRQLLEAHRG